MTSDGAGYMATYEVDAAAAIGGADGPTEIYIEANHVDEDGNILDADGNLVGQIIIDENGEGIITYNE